jgi:hypothetical protein
MFHFKMKSNRHRLQELHKLSLAEDKSHIMESVAGLSLVTSSDGDPSWAGSEMLKTAHKVQHHRHFLIERIEPNYGLLYELSKQNVITYRQQKECSIPYTTIYKRNEAILELLVGKSEEEHKLFLTALRETSQLHIVNYILHNGVYDDQLNDVWPLDEKQFYKLITNQLCLVDQLAIKPDLLERLLTLRCINYQQMKSIYDTAMQSDQIDMLVDILTRRSVADFKNFILCLRETHQSHLLYMFDGTEFSSITDRYNESRSGFKGLPGALPNMEVTGLETEGITEI